MLGQGAGGALADARVPKHPALGAPIPRPIDRSSLRNGGSTNLAHTPSRAACPSTFKSKEPEVEVALILRLGAFAQVANGAVKLHPRL